MGNEDETTYRIRTATPIDIEEIVRIMNLAYVVEHPLIRGERTDAAEVGERMHAGRFLVMEADGTGGGLCGSVFMSLEKGRGYLGMLAIDPALQGRGLAGRLIKAVETECLREDCPFLDITVLSLRKELFPFYRHCGFAASAVLPYPRPELLIKPLRLVQMTKALRPDEAL